MANNGIRGATSCSFQQQWCKPGESHLTCITLKKAHFLLQHKYLTLDAPLAILLISCLMDVFVISLCYNKNSGLAQVMVAHP